MTPSGAVVTHKGCKVRYIPVDGWRGEVSTESPEDFRITKPLGFPVLEVGDMSDRIPLTQHNELDRFTMDIDQDRAEFEAWFVDYFKGSESFNPDYPVIAADMLEAWRAAWHAALKQQDTHIADLTTKLRWLAEIVVKCKLTEDANASQEEEAYDLLCEAHDLAAKALAEIGGGE